MINKNSFDYGWKDNHSTPEITKKIVKVLNKLKLQNFTHIDIGCGNGEITKKICHFFKILQQLICQRRQFKLQKKII